MSVDDAVYRSGMIDVGQCSPGCPLPAPTEERSSASSEVHPSTHPNQWGYRRQPPPQLSTLLGDLDVIPGVSLKRRLRRWLNLISLVFRRWHILPDRFIELLRCLILDLNVLAPSVDKELVTYSRADWTV